MSETRAQTDRERGVTVGGWGKYIPRRVLTNADLERMVDTSDEWIVTRTGIRERHIAADHEGTTSMMLAASHEALQRAGVDGTHVQLIITATVSPDFQFPAVACLLQAALGARAAAFDIQAGCSGFMYALVTAVQFIQAGVYDRALVAGGDTLSRLVDWTDRSTCILFGDGAGAVYLEATDGPGDFRSMELGADGTYPAALYMDGVARPCRVEPESGRAGGIAALRSPARHITMDGQRVFRFATHAMSDAVASVSAAAGWDLEQIDLIIPHQANQRIIEAASKTLGLPLERFYTNVERYGNMSDVLAASISSSVSSWIPSSGTVPSTTLVARSSRDAVLAAESSVSLAGWGPALVHAQAAGIALERLVAARLAVTYVDRYGRTTGPYDVARVRAVVRQLQGAGRGSAA